MKSRTCSLTVLTLLILLVPLSGLLAQDPGAKKPLPIEEYGLWRSITSTAISNNGEWICYGYSKRETDDTLHVKSLENETEYVIALASGARFSDDAKWIAYALSEPQSERDRGAEPAQPTAPGGRGGRGGGAAGRKAELMNLETGEKLTWENVSNFAFSEDSRFFAARKVKADREAEHDGTDLILRNLSEGYEELIGSVSDFAFNKPSTALVYTVDTADRDGNGLYVIFLEAGRRRPLDNDKAKYEQMTLDEEGTAVAVLKGNDDEQLEQRENVLLAFTGLDRASPVRHEYNPADASDFPEGMVISQLGSMNWNDDATRIFFGIKEQKEKPAEGGNRRGRGGQGGEGEQEEEQEEEQEDEEEEPVADVDIWHCNEHPVSDRGVIRHYITYLAHSSLLHNK